LRQKKPPPADEVLSNYVAAIERLTTRVCVGRTVTDLSWKDPSVEVESFVAWATVPDGVRIVTEEPDGAVIVQVGDADSAWRYDRGGVKPDPELARSKLAWLLNPQNALRVQEYFPALETKGREVLNGHEVWVLEPADMDATYWRLAFDVETGLLVQIGYYWTLEDYGEVDGVLFPFRVSESRKGGSTTHIFDHVWHGPSH
jgi:hypothetical protein